MHQYYHAPSNIRHNASTLRRRGLRPNSSGVFPLLPDRPNYDMDFETIRDTGTTLIINGNAYYNYEVIDKPIDVILPNLLEKVNKLRDEKMEKGAKINFSEFGGDITAITADGQTEAAGERHLQTRGGDVLNWTALATAALASVTLGQGLTFNIRTKCNAIIKLSDQQTLQAMLQTMAQQSLLMATSWALKNRIESAVTVDELRKINIEEELLNG